MIRQQQKPQALPVGACGLIGTVNVCGDAFARVDEPLRHLVQRDIRCRRCYNLTSRSARRHDPWVLRPCRRRRRKCALLRSDDLRKGLLGLNAVFL